MAEPSEMFGSRVAGFIHMFDGKSYVVIESSMLTDTRAAGDPTPVGTLSMIGQPQRVIVDAILLDTTT